MEHVPVTEDTHGEDETDTHPNQDENQHMRTVLLRVERRLVELSQEMGVQENINRLLRQEQQELEESLEERDSRLAEAHETISTLQNERENLVQQLQTIQEQAEMESRKHQDLMLTCSQSSQPCTVNRDTKNKACVNLPNSAASCSVESSSTATDTGGVTERSPHPAPLRMASLSVRLVDCRAKLGPNGCVNVAQ